MITSLGIIETKGYSAASSAADKILENKKIKLIKAEKIGAGIITLFFEGDYDHLKTSLEKGIQQARLVGEIVAVHILKNPNENIKKFLILNDISSSFVPVSKNEGAKEKIFTSVSETGKEKPKIKKLRKDSTKRVVEENKPKKSYLFSSSSKIQRLRREALSSGKLEKEKTVKPDIRKGKEFSQINLSKIEKMNVHELRRLARSTSGFPIQGREISRANRKELVNYFKEIA